MTLEQFEDEIIREALRRADGNKSQAARLLGLSRNALRYRLAKIGVPDEEEGSKQQQAVAVFGVHSCRKRSDVSIHRKSRRPREQVRATDLGLEGEVPARRGVTFEWCPGFR